MSEVALNDKVKVNRKTAALSPQQERWSAAVYKALGWAAIKEAKGNRPVYSDPSRRYAERFDEAKKIDREALKTQLIEDERTRDALRLELAKLGPEDNTDRIHEKLDAIDEKIAEEQAELALLGKTRARLEKITDTERDLGGGLETMTDEVRALREELAALDSDGDEEAARRTAIEDLPEGDRDKFVFMRDGIASNIERAVRELFQLDKIIPVDGSDPVRKKRLYPVINRREYAILYGMLEKAELMLLTKGLADALGMLEKTKAQLADFRTARTGATEIVAPESTIPELDQKFSEIEGFEIALRTSGFNAAADELKDKRETLLMNVKGAISGGAENVVAQFKSDISELVGAGRSLIGARDAIRGEIDETRRLMKNLEANERVNLLFYAEQIVEDFEPTGDLVASLAEAQRVHKEVAELKNQSLANLLKDEKVDREPLEQRLEELEKLYDSFFKHQKDGSVTMITDSQTRQKKGAKKNSKLPREAIREFELMIAASKQLLESGSLDALKKADMWLSGTKTAMQNVKDKPDVYVSINYQLKALEAKVTHLEDKYQPYCVARRSELKAKLKELRSKENTIFQAEIFKEIEILGKALDKLKVEIIVLRGRKRALAKTADTVESTLNDIGKKLKASYAVLFAGGLDGYHGEMRDTLKEVRDNISKRRPDTLDAAEDDLTRIQAHANRMLEMIGRDINAKSKKRFSNQAKGEPIKPNEDRVLQQFLREAESGQKIHNAQKANKKPFENGVKKLKEDLSKLKTKAEAAGMDATDIQVLLDEGEALKAEIKSSEDYSDGVARLAKLTARYDKLKGEVDGAKEMADKTLAAAAKAVTDDIKAFKAYLPNFVTKHVRRAGEGNTVNDLDAQDDKGQNLFDTGKIDAYITAVGGAIPDKAINDIASNASLVADKQKAIPDRKLARKAALAGVRSLMATFDGFAPMGHFAGQPFDESAPDINVIRRALPRLEIKLLSAIEK